MKKGKWDLNIIILISLVILVIAVGLLFPKFFQTAITNTGNPIGISEMPAHEFYQIEPREIRYVPYSQDVKFGDYVFKSTYSASYYEQSCKPITGYNCNYVSTDKYGCEIKNCQYLTDPISCNCPSSCYACVCIACDIGGVGYIASGLKCTDSAWSSYGCRYNDLTARRNEGGFDTKKIDNAGLTWEIYYSGQKIGGQTDFARNNIYFYDGTTFCNDIYVKDNQISCSSFDGNYDYNIYRGSVGTLKDGTPEIGIKFNNPSRLTESIEANLSVKNSYISGDIAYLTLNVCNNADRIFKGIYTATYTFDTFVGSISKSQRNDFDILTGCNDYKVEINTQKTTDKVTIASDLKLYENRYEGLFVNREKVLDKETINFDGVVLTQSDYVLIGNAQFDDKIVTILPKYTEEYVSSLILYAEQIRNESIETQAKLLSDKELTEQELDLLAERLTSSEQEKQDLINQVNSEKSKQNLIIIGISVVAVIAVETLSLMIFRPKRKKR